MNDPVQRGVAFNFGGRKAFPSMACRQDRLRCDIARSRSSRRETMDQNAGFDGQELWERGDMTATVGLMSLALEKGLEGYACVSQAMSGTRLHMSYKGGRALLLEELRGP